MLALGASQALEGVATSATTVTYTITGLLMNNASPPASTSYEQLAQGQLASSVGSIYNPGGSATALISSINLFNTGGSTQTVSLYIGGTAGANQIATFSIPSGGWAVYEDGDGWQVLNSSGSLQSVGNYTLNTSARTSSASVSAGEYTIFSGSSTGQTMTLPTSPADGTPYTLANLSTVAVSVAPGGVNTLSTNQTTGTYSVPVGGFVSWIYNASGTTWYAVSSNLFSLILQGTPATATQAAATMTASSANIVSGSLFQIPTGTLVANSTYRFTIQVAKTAAGVATWTAAVKFGTSGTAADGSIATWTSGTNTAAIDSATLVIMVNILTTGAGATANCQAFYQNQLTTTTGLGSIGIVPGSTGAFNSTVSNPYFHIDFTPGASAVMNATCFAERLK